MNTTEVREMVRNRYGGIAAGGAGCCGAADSAQETSCSMGYSEAELASLPEGADLGLGCGNPQAFAAMRPGEVVVDLGSGAVLTSSAMARRPPSLSTRKASR